MNFNDASERLQRNRNDIKEELAKLVSMDDLTAWKLELLAKQLKIADKMLSQMYEIENYLNPKPKEVTNG